MAHLTKDELIELVRRIMTADGSEDEIDAWQDLLENNVPHPAVSDLIFYPDREMTAEEIVDAALNYRPLSVPRSPEE